MTAVREQYVSAARDLAQLFRTPELKERWDEPSALAGWTVRVLAGHLGRVVAVPRYVLEADPPQGPPTGGDGITLGGNNERTAERDQTAREHAAEYAGESPSTLIGRYERDIEALSALVDIQPPERLVLTKGTRVVELDRYLIGRALELFVHADDLAVSLAVRAPQPPKELMRLVLDLLLSAAVTRHGDVRVLRALTRRERDDVDALRVI